MTALDRLVEIANQIDMTPKRSKEELLLKVTDPKFDKASIVHDWRNHVNDTVAEVWDEITTIGQLALYIEAACRAHNEEWD